jgi:hypothetical protein
MDEQEAKAEVKPEDLPGLHDNQVQVGVCNLPGALDNQQQAAPRSRYANCGKSDGSKRTQFKLGNSANPHGRRGKPRPVLSRERHDEYDVMIHVYQNQESADWTYQQSIYRHWLKTDVSAFMNRLVRYEVKRMRSETNRLRDETKRMRRRRT